MKCPYCKEDVEFSYKEDVVASGSVDFHKGGYTLEEQDIDSDGGESVEIWCNECNHTISLEELRQVKDYANKLMCRDEQLRANLESVQEGRQSDI